ncbi:hypothetical protein [Thiococcus pfennigii]|uniref:hypothetical protein n=1 Tax=Thiococcus pfennigii TaxID=1057 RepID=UPI0019079F49|nr:hypothetical protein [Thiococcus pfennigii]
MDDTLEEAISNIKLRLRDFSAPKPDAPDLVWGTEGQRISIERYQFPIPNLLLFILHGVCGFSLGWRGEKMHWCVPFAYKGINCTIAFEKFGLRLYIDKLKNEINPKEVLGKLEKAIGSAEKHILSALAQQQITAGNITTEVSRFPQATNRMTAAMRGFRVPWPGSPQSTPKPTSASSWASARRTSAKAYSVRRAAA